MGEYADYILNGDDCQGCGEYIGEGDGYPRFCAGCGGGDEPIAPDTSIRRDKNRRKRKNKKRNKRNREAAMKYIGQLPQSDKPWQFTAFKGGIVCCNPDHPPMMVIDGKLEVIRVEPPKDA